MTTVAEAITKVALNLSLVTGTNMSPFSDDQLGQYLSNANDMIMAKGNWPELEATATKVLDGTTGKITVAFTAADGLTDYKYIKQVYTQASQSPLPKIARRGNPLFELPQIGWKPLNIVDDPNKQYFFSVYPVTQTGSCAIVYNIKLDFSDPDTVIPVDDLLHIWCATWMYAEDDGTNPGQAEKYFNLFQDRWKDIHGLANSGDVSLTTASAPDTMWRELDQ